ncbi:FkbM family methyltransferase [Dehalobacter sp. DCA]|uniref:FkbM family methyltransferase n=1 Tax=Dehalobacter sp. DCA TaxID=1147129 RepID=UPI001FA6AB6E|nr:FkbM family methyltransferase [Dehalobacter sp. DCA]
MNVTIKQLLQNLQFDTKKDGCACALDGNQPVIIYGAGYCGALFCELMLKADIRPVCFFDCNEAKAGAEMMGTKICLPKTLENSEQYFVVVCMFQKGILFDQIKEMLTGMGYAHVIHVYEIRYDRKFFNGQNLIISPDLLLLRKNKSSIERVHGLLSDELSKDTYLKLMEFLIQDYDASIPSLPIREQYFAYDVYERKDNEVFVDCGAFKGEVMDIFISRNHAKFREYLAIEPDTAYVKILEKKKKEYGDDRIAILPVAASDSIGIVNIRNYANENLVVVADGESSVNCLPLDYLLSKKIPTLIKIDVEGYEQNVLNGAESMIKAYQPVLAVAIYHKERDFWEIPLKIKEKYPFYSLFIRSYMNIQETILYAVPPSRKVRMVLNEIS